ncbi:transmembrane protein 45B [Aplysia californica]|uniref:Transmembrane protein 45B n=1 Tax=Aplysia californica TaxID=6500 RepID=A0ABM0K5X7_APLCA|nr:transmembrane protein 45B [Aplysia californica]XP_005113449.2 transmembrane protein 45B [Aplysia californica]
MGDLKGHALPGSLFLFYGLWWALCCMRRYLNCRKAGRRYIATATYGCPCACGRLGSLPIEAILKIFLSAVGMFCEITFNLPHPSHGIVQHATMYFFFLLSGIVDVVMHAGVPLPPGSDYMGIVLAFTVEGLLFANHLHDRPVLDVHIHVLLVYVVFLTVVVIMLEAKFQRSAILAMSRAYLLMLQGSWFWAVGIILYGHGDENTVWDMKSHEHVMLSTIYFSWHCAAHFIILFFMCLGLYLLHRRINGPLPNGSGPSSIPLTQLGDNGKSEGYRRLAFTDEVEEDSDIEFEKPVEKALVPAGSNV